MSSYFSIPTHAVCSQQCCSLTDSLGKQLKGAWGSLAGAGAAAAGLPESCKEQHCHINTSAKGPGPSQPFCSDTFMNLVSQPVVRCRMKSFSDLLEMTAEMQEMIRTTGNYERSFKHGGGSHFISRKKK